MTTRSGLTPLVSASAWSQRVPPRGSTREKLIIWPPLPRRPDLRSSSRQSDWRRVGPERAMEASAGWGWVAEGKEEEKADPSPPSAKDAAGFGRTTVGGGGGLGAGGPRSSMDLTLGAGTASTVKGPEMRARELS